MVIYCIALIDRRGNAWGITYTYEGYIMLKSRFIEFLKDEEGASAIEYALVASMVAVALVTFITPIRDAVKEIFTSIQTALGK